MIAFTSALYCRVSLGLRQTVEVVNIMNEFFGKPFGEVPAYTSIGYWVQKLGLSVYKKTPNLLKDKRYALIVDESMMIGSEKLLQVIAVPADNVGHAISDKDMKIVHLSVDRAWNSAAVGKTLKDVVEKIGHAPEYVISDNEAKMCKAIRDAGYIHHRDISHSLGMFLERNYKNEDDFKAFSTEVSNARAKYNMQKIAYLQPPAQRTIARFINMSHWVSWAKVMLQNYDKLPGEAQKIYPFISENAPLIKELDEVMSCINCIEKEIKTNGISRESVAKCKSLVSNGILLGKSRQKEVATSILEYLDNEVALLKDGEAHHASSDGIERTFGILKARRSDDKLAGVTPIVLMLPLRQALAPLDNFWQLNYKEHLENNKISDIEEWCQKNLRENLTQKRINTLYANAQ